jgi:hypothetical protein
MTIWEYLKAVDNMRMWQALPQEDKLLKRNLHKYVNAVITAKSHAWCMDVDIERKKMAEVVLEILDEVEKHGY